MNNVVLVGNLARDPEQRTTPAGVPVTTFTVAVNRNFKGPDGNYDADFISCVAWRSTAEFVAKWFRKGKPIGVTGRLQTRSYDDKQGQRRYVTEVVVENVEFVGSKSDSGYGGGGGSGYGGGYSQSSQSGSSAPAPQRQSAPPPPPSGGGDPLFQDDIDASSFESLEDSELPF